MEYNVINKLQNGHYHHHDDIEKKNNRSCFKIWQTTHTQAMEQSD